MFHLKGLIYTAGHGEVKEIDTPGHPEASNIIAGLSMPHADSCVCPPDLKQLRLRKSSCLSIQTFNT